MGHKTSSTFPVSFILCIERERERERGERKWENTNEKREIDEGERRGRRIQLRTKHLQEDVGTKDVRVDVKLNKQISSKGIRSAPRSVRVRIARNRTMMKMQRKNSTQLVTVAEIPAEGLQGLGTKVIEECDD